MELNARPPEKLSDSGNISANWNRWKKEFQTFMKLSKGCEKPHDYQTACLRNLIGPVGLDILEKIPFDNPDDEENITIVFKKLDQFFNPKRNEIKERFKFFSKSKTNNESIDEFIGDLMEMSKSCNFGNQAKSLIRDVVILDIKDESLQNILFEEKDLTLDKLKIIYKTYEGINSGKMKDEAKKLIAEKESESSIGPECFKRPCWKCGKRHPLKKCPAFKIVCNYCKHYNHLAHCCPVAKADKAKFSEISNTGPSRENPQRIENIFSYSSDVNKPPIEFSQKNSKIQSKNPGMKSAHSSSLKDLQQGMVQNKFSHNNDVRKVFQKDSKIQGPMKNIVKNSTPLESLMDTKCEKLHDTQKMGKKISNIDVTSVSPQKNTKPIKNPLMDDSASSENQHGPVPPAYNSLYPQLQTEVPAVSSFNNGQNTQGPNAHYNKPKPDYNLQNNQSNPQNSQSSSQNSQPQNNPPYNPNYNQSNPQNNQSSSQNNPNYNQSNPQNNQSSSQNNPPYNPNYNRPNPRNQEMPKQNVSQVQPEITTHKNGQNAQGSNTDYNQPSPNNNQSNPHLNSFSNQSKPRQEKPKQKSETDCTIQ